MSPTLALKTCVLPMHVKNTNYPSIGLALRATREGLESDLVTSFLAERNWEIPHGSELTMFEQPKLECGFPDIVFVVWDKKIAGSWSEQRLLITPPDIRVVHYLVSAGPSTISQLLAVFGRRVFDSIDRLAAAEMIYLKSGSWQSEELQKLFAVQQIAAFEAKIDAPSQAVLQASRNRWFASHSYIVVPKKLRTAGSVRSAQQFGVGVWAFHRNQWLCTTPSAVEKLPRSYASWLFNEWVWRIHRTMLGGPAGSLA